MSHYFECESLSGYIFIQDMSNGFFGPTSLFRHKENNTMHVIKTFRKSLIGGTEKILSFMAKFERNRGISRHYVVAYTDCIEHGDYLFMVRPYIDGKSLNEFVYEHELDNKKQVFSLWRNIVQCYFALSVYGSCPSPIKPNNIFITRDKFISITDLYDLSIDVSWALQTPDTNHLLFLAPEFFIPSHDLSAQSDIWSLGAILMFIIKVRLPWKSNNVISMVKAMSNSDPEIPDQVSPDIRAILLQILKVNPSERATFEELLDPNFEYRLSPRKRRLTAPSPNNQVITAGMSVLFSQGSTPNRDPVKNTSRQIKAQPFNFYVKNKNRSNSAMAPQSSSLMNLLQPSKSVTLANSNVDPSQSTSFTVKYRFGAPLPLPSMRYHNLDPPHKQS